jgi:hypothetical protein
VAVDDMVAIWGNAANYKANRAISAPPGRDARLFWPFGLGSEVAMRAGRAPDRHRVGVGPVLAGLLVRLSHMLGAAARDKLRLTLTVLLTLCIITGFRAWCVGKNES